MSSTELYATTLARLGNGAGVALLDALNSKEGKAEGKRMSENDRKKEYLKGYQRALREIDRIRGLIQELQIDKMCPSLIQDGMPHGSGTSDLSEYMAKKENLEMRLLKAQEAALEELDDITDHIDRLRNDNEIDVLFNRYIKGMGWEEIAEKMGYSWQWIHKIHSSALKNLRID